MNIRKIPNKQISSFEFLEAAYWSDYFKAASPELVKKLGVQFFKIGSAYVTVAAKVDILAFNRVIGLGVGEPATENQIDEIIAIYEKEKVPRFFIQPSPAAHPDYFPDLLQKKGFKHYNNWVKWYRQIEDFPGFETDLCIEQIDRNYTDVFADIIVTSFEWPEILKPFIAEVVGRPGWKHYLAYKDEKVIACAACFIKDENASLAFAATLPPYRGHGAQSALINRRLKDAIDAGCKWMITETAEETAERSVASYRNMKRNGFDIAYKRPNYLYAF